MLDASWAVRFVCACRHLTWVLAVGKLFAKFAGMSFDFKHFHVSDSRCAMKVGTDGVLLGASVDIAEGVGTVLDIGAGSGVVSLILAQRAAACRIVAVEVDDGAAADCSENFAASPWASRLSVHVGDALTFRPDFQPDMIVSNPPFFLEPVQSPDAARARARHADTLSPQAVVRYAAAWLSPRGSVALILPAGCVDDVVYVAEMLHLKERFRLDIRPKTDLLPLRTILQFARTDGPIVRSILSLRTSQGKPTQEYRRLTEDLYLNLK